MHLTGLLMQASKMHVHSLILTTPPIYCRCDYVSAPASRRQPGAFGEFKTQSCFLSQPENTILNIFSRQYLFASRILSLTLTLSFALVRTLRFLHRLFAAGNSSAAAAATPPPCNLCSSTPPPTSESAAPPSPSRPRCKALRCRGALVGRVCLSLGPRPCDERWSPSCSQVRIGAAFTESIHRRTPIPHCFPSVF